MINCLVYVLICYLSADALITPAALPESSHTDVSASGEASGFTVLGDVKPRTLKKVHKNWPLL